VLIAFRIGAQDSLAAMAGLLAVLAIAIQQSFRVTAAIRRAHLAGGGQLTRDVVAAAAADAGGPSITAAAVAAAALVPFIVMGDTAGNELLYTAAVVAAVGLGAATLLNTLVLPAACLRFGPARAPEQDRDLTRVPSVPRPREEPEMPDVLQPTGPPQSEEGGTRAPLQS
jgi:Cu/Ag efflux pump CusA